MKQEPLNPALTRRDFIRHSAGAAGAIGLATINSDLVEAAEPAVRTATDWVQLGRLSKNKLMITRLGMGTGSINGRVQMELGQPAFNKLIQYGFDRGIRYIDTAKNYLTYGMIREAIKPLPRDKFFLLSKMPSGGTGPQDPLKVIDQYRKDLGTDYIDALLIHCTVTADWPERMKVVMDAFDEAQARGWIRAKGMSCHGLSALRVAAKSDWLEVQLARINPQGHHVDGDNPTNPHDPNGKVPEAMKEIKSMHDKGRGVIAMKLVGNGDFTSADDREKAARYVMSCGFVDACVMGFKSPAEIDEGIERVNRALKLA
jgi:predicted aldo/keto reductase-like oxidoreductase